MLEFRVGALGYIGEPKLQPGTILTLNHKPYIVSSFITMFGNTRGSHLGECEVEGLRVFNSGWGRMVRGMVIYGLRFAVVRV